MLKGNLVPLLMGNGVQLLNFENCTPDRTFESQARDALRAAVGGAASHSCLVVMPDLPKGMDISPFTDDVVAEAVTDGGFDDALAVNLRRASTTPQRMRSIAEAIDDLTGEPEDNIVVIADLHYLVPQGKSLDGTRDKFSRPRKAALDRLLGLGGLEPLTSNVCATANVKSPDSDPLVSRAREARWDIITFNDRIPREIAKVILQNWGPFQLSVDCDDVLDHILRTQPTLPRDGTGYGGDDPVSYISLHYRLRRSVDEIRREMLKTR